jgi:hypothetical protein
MIFSLIVSYVVLLFTELGQEVTHLANKENTQSEILHFVLLGLWYKMPSDMVEILSLQSPHKLLKNLGALSKYAKCSQSLTKINHFLKSLSYILDTTYNGKKPSQATVTWRPLGADTPPPPPLPLHVAKAGRNHLNEETTLLPTGIDQRHSQTKHVKLGHAALLRRCELPLRGPSL